ncbi:MAG TPA: hypothetical protein VM734_29020 [Kofleriaceae bacterium]|jgi:hypothetical protein|nr:hypothetical protein [Kofleriaceae bacterium]
MIRTTATIVIAAALAAACSKDGGAAAGGGTGDDAVVAAWKKAGLEVSALTDADAKAYSAEGCRSGTVSGVDVVLCKYDTGEDAKAAEDPALTSLGGVTGAAIAKGARLLVVADRRKADPTGRTIDAITKAFRK